MAASVYTSAANTVSTLTTNGGYDGLSYLNTASDAGWSDPTSGFTKNLAPEDRNKFVVKTFLENTAPNLVFDKFAMVQPIPMNSGKTVYFNKLLDFEYDDASNYELKDGITPEGSGYQMTTVNATLKQYGNYVRYTDQFDMTNTYGLIEQIKKALPVQAERILDNVYRDVLLSTGNWFNAGGVSTIAGNVTAPSVSDIQAMITFFENRNVPKITSALAGSTAIGTVPVDEAYVMYIHPDQRFLFEALTGFTKAKDYPSGNSRMAGEVGTISNMKVIATSKCKKIASGTAITLPSGNAGTTTETVYQNIVLGKDAYGIVPLAGQRTAQVLINPFKASDSDPLAQRATIAWKVMTTAIILDPQRVIIYNTGAA